MKVKELIKELEKFNPDGVVEVCCIQTPNFTMDGKVIGVEDEGCAMINPCIIAKT